MRIESWLDVTLTSTTNVIGNLLVAPATRTLTYDDDGNLTADGLWTYQWDGENRLKQVESAGTVPTAARRKLVLTYDHLGRRSTKKVYLWSGGGYSATPTADLRFIYDAWNMVGEVNATNSTPIRSYVWGQDLSGSLQGAGGIGGLLVVRDHGAGTYHFTGYDGNGNVTVLVNAADQGLSAQYEYSPFGETLRATGPLAKSNPFRFSTKFADEESDLVYYGYRYYSPSLMRWISRDPVEELGGQNLYGFLLNSPTFAFDPDGRTPQQLAGLAGVGGTAKFAADLFNASSFAYFPGVPLQATKNYLQGMALGMSVGIDIALGGRLLKNVGGPTSFVAEQVGGAGLGVVKGLHHQSFAKAVVAGRLESVAAIGLAAARSVGGNAPDAGDELGMAAQGFLQAARRGESAWADLDAALLGSAIGNRKARGDMVNISGMLFDLWKQDAASAFSRLGSYQALNAWDMADDLQGFVEGM